MKVEAVGTDSPCSSETSEPDPRMKSEETKAKAQAAVPKDKDRERLRPWHEAFPSAHLSVADRLTVEPVPKASSAVLANAEVGADQRVTVEPKTQAVAAYPCLDTDQTCDSRSLAQTNLNADHSVGLAVFPQQKDRER